MSSTTPSPASDPPASASIRIHVLFFGILAQQTGQPYLSLELNAPATVETALLHLQARFPGIAAFRSKLAFGVNLAYVPVTHSLHDRDELALIPPVSGG